jgi:hypothetical protein
MSILAELEQRWQRVVDPYQHKTVQRGRDNAEEMAYADPANRALVNRITLLRNIVKWHVRLASITAERFHPSERPLHDRHVLEARSAVMRECSAALAGVNDERDREFIRALVAKHEAGADAAAVLHFVQTRR